MREYKLTLSGKQISTADHFDVINPATEEIIAKCPQASNEQVDLACQGAHDALKQWQDFTMEERQRYFTKAASLLEAHKDELAELLTHEQGKPLAQAMSETEAAIAKLNFSSSFTAPVHVLLDNAEKKVEVIYKPLGVICAITPWNFPLSIGMGKFAMAALAGNTVVLKPSPYTPLTSLRMGELLNQVFPAGVLNIITGLDDVAKQLTAHPLIAKYTFTGSVPTGKVIAKLAADRLTPATLELGGNDAAIVLDDINLHDVAPKLFWSAFGNCGQICIATKRLFVQESIADELTNALVKLAKEVKVGNGLDDGVTMGPLNNTNQRRIVHELVEDAKANGAHVLCGGKPIDGPGYFYEPTLINNVTDQTRIVREEQFGPVLPILSFKTPNEAIERANALPFGLGGSVWSSDLSKATDIAQQLETGLAWVNNRGAATPDAPFGGVKQSGIGRENGLWGFEEVTEKQTLVIAK